MSLGFRPWAHLKKFSIATHNHIKSQILLNNLRVHTHFIERQTFHLMQKLASMHFLFLQIYMSFRIVNKSDIMFSKDVFGFIQTISYHLFVLTETINFRRDNR